MRFISMFLFLIAIFAQAAFAQKPSQIKSDTGATIRDIGYNAQKIAETLTKNRIHALIIASDPCTECDIETELVLYNLEAKKKKGVILPGRYTLPESDDLIQEAHGFYGQCSADDFGVWILERSRDENGVWTFEESHYTFSKTGIVENKKKLNAKDFDSSYEKLKKARECKQLEEQTHTSCC